MEVPRSAERAEVRRDTLPDQGHKIEWQQRRCDVQSETDKQRTNHSEHSLRTTNLLMPPLKMRPSPNPLLTRGGTSHSSTYGCQKSGPFPRDSIVCAYARSRATRRLCERQNEMIAVTCDAMKNRVASAR